jgi:hypothetical protein
MSRKLSLGGRVAQRGGLYGGVQRVRPAELAEGFVLDSRQHRGIDFYPTLVCEVKRENGQDIVMARNARPLGDKRCGRALEQGQSSRHRAARFYLHRAALLCLHRAARLCFHRAARLGAGLRKQAAAGYRQQNDIAH